MRDDNMNQLQNDLTRRLLYVLHYGLAEIRNLAIDQGNEQVADLADALEVLPGLIDHWEDENLDFVHLVLRDYQAKYPGRAFDYLEHVDKYDPPDRF
jgi:hypothetical protein